MCVPPGAACCLQGHPEPETPAETLRSQGRTRSVCTPVLFTAPATHELPRTCLCSRRGVSLPGPPDRLPAQTHVARLRPAPGDPQTIACLTSSDRCANQGQRMPRPLLCRTKTVGPDHVWPPILKVRGPHKVTLPAKGTRRDSAQKPGHRTKVTCPGVIWSDCPPTGFALSPFSG